VPTQVALHAPSMQNWPGKHALPQLPQSLVLAKLTHCPAQNPRPMPQTFRHALAWQTSPGAHAASHIPQC
jgi:hypothetical protein